MHGVGKTWRSSHGGTKQASWVRFVFPGLVKIFKASWRLSSILTAQSKSTYLQRPPLGPEIHYREQADEVSGTSTVEGRVVRSSHKGWPCPAPVTGTISLGISGGCFRVYAD